MIFASKANLKFVKSLHLKKFRDKNNCFIVEGEKLLDEVLRFSPDSIKQIYSTEQERFNFKGEQFIISEKELNQISSLKNPNKHLAVVSKFSTNHDSTFF